MAYTSAHTPASTSVLAPVGRFFTAIWDGLVAIGAANSKVRQVEALSALSDAELAARGLRRQDIVKYVMIESGWV